MFDRPHTVPLNSKNSAPIISQSSRVPLSYDGTERGGKVCSYLPRIEGLRIPICRWRIKNSKALQRPAVSGVRHGLGGGGCCFFTMIGGGVHSESRQIRYKGVPNRAGIWQSIWVRQALRPRNQVDEKDNSMNKLIGLASCTALAMMSAAPPASPPPATTPDGLELIALRTARCISSPMRRSTNFGVVPCVAAFRKTGSATTTPRTAAPASRSNSAT